MDRIPADGGCGWKNEDSKRGMEKMRINQKNKNKTRKCRKQKKKKNKQTQKGKKKERKKGKRRSVPPLLRTAVKIQCIHVFASLRSGPRGRKLISLRNPLT